MAFHDLRRQPAAAGAQGESGCRCSASCPEQEDSGVACCGECLPVLSMHVCTALHGCGHRLPARPPAPPLVRPCPARRAPGVGGLCAAEDGGVLKHKLRKVKVGDLQGAGGQPEPWRATCVLCLLVLAARLCTCAPLPARSWEVTQRFCTQPPSSTLEGGRQLECKRGSGELHKASERQGC